MKGVMVKNSSEWALYDGRNNGPFTPYCQIGPKENLTETDKEKVKNLRNWAEKFFSKKS